MKNRGGWGKEEEDKGSVYLDILVMRPVLPFVNELSEAQISSVALYSPIESHGVGPKTQPYFISTLCHIYSSLVGN